jgi:hypothetical protein
LGKKTGLKTQIRLKLDDEPELLKMFDKIKGKIGIQSNVDLIRMLINEKYEQLGLKNNLPRFEKINNDENGVKILDRTLGDDVEVYIKPNGIVCGYDKTDDCDHIRYALSFPEVRRLIKKHRKEGWKLPDV